MTERIKEFERQPIQSGINVICGSMFSGKSEELIRQVRLLPYAKYSVLVFKPETDFRRGVNSINSASGHEYPAISVKKSADILDAIKKLNPDTDVIAIDEAQFFDMNLVEVCQVLAAQGKKVLVAGLDLDFRGEPFGPMGKLKQIATHTETKHAYCTHCGREASRTQRLVNKRPANYDEPIILVGAEESYEARCLDHHEVPGKPEVGLKKEGVFEGKIKFFLPGSGEVEDLIEKILCESGYLVYRPPSKNGQDIDLLTDEERDQKALCHAAVFGPGRAPEIGSLIRPVGIGEAREWVKSRKPSLLFIRGKIQEPRNSPSKDLYTFVHGYTGPEQLQTELTNFALEVRRELSKSS